PSTSTLFPYTTLFRSTGYSPAFPYTVFSLAIAPKDRAVLHARIAERFHQMLDDGLVAEVQALRTRGDLAPELPAIKSVGYRQVRSEEHTSELQSREKL